MHAPEPPAVTLRMATCNILHGVIGATGEPDVEEVASWLAGLDADIVALQEVDRGQPRSGGVDQAAAIADHLGWHHAFGAALVGNPDADWDVPPPGQALHDPSYGVAVLARDRLTDVRVTALPGGGAGRRTVPASHRPGYDREPRVALSVTVHLPSATLRVTTTHLSYLPWRGLRQARVAAAAGAAGRGPAVLLGDLNLPAWAVRVLLAVPVSRRWTHAGGRRTYPAWRPRVQTDQLLVRGGVRVSSVRVSRTTTSDHLPLLATVSVPRR